MARAPDWLKLRHTGRWSLNTTVHGRRIREALRTRNLNEAIVLGQVRLAELHRRGPIALRATKLTFDDLAQELIRDYETNGRRSIGKAKKSIERLGEFFGGWRATNMSTADVRAYVDKRQQASFSNGSINRELAALKRAFRLAAKAKLLSHDQIPDIPMLQEAPPRSGFFEADQFQMVLRHLPVAIQPVALFGYETGWRLREIITLEWRQVDLQAGSVRLDPGTTKNRDGRIAYLSPGLLDVLRTQAASTRELEYKKGQIIPWVFHRRGRRILRFLAAWQTACKNAGVPGMFFHDLRRTAIRNMVRAGIPERVAMQISGHKTRSVFERYNIVSEGDLREAAQRLASYAHSNGTAAQRGGPKRRTATHQRFP
jgi:integrase